MKAKKKIKKEDMNIRIQVIEERHLALAKLQALESSRLDKLLQAMWDNHALSEVAAKAGWIPF
jgi:hypothetical protein